MANLSVKDADPRSQNAREREHDKQVPASLLNRRADPRATDSKVAAKQISRSLSAWSKPPVDRDEATNSDEPSAAKPSSSRSIHVAAKLASMAGGGANKRLFRFRDDRDKAPKPTSTGGADARTTTLLEDKRKLAKTYVEAAQKQGELYQAVVKTLVSTVSDIVAIASGPFGVAAQGVIKTSLTLATTAGDIGAKIHRDLKVGVINRAIEKMGEEELESYLMRWKEHPPRLSEIQAQLSPQIAKVHEEISYGERALHAATGAKEGTGASAMNAAGKGYGAVKDVGLGAASLKDGTAKIATDITHDHTKDIPGVLAKAVTKVGGNGPVIIGAAKNFAKKLGDVVPVLGTLINTGMLIKAAVDLQSVKGEIKKLEAQVQQKETNPECAPAD